ncbi:tryptophan synthase subunit beta [Saccharothrix sp. NRRL B-16314]|uniref:tryptophan synthase subunit beta n=1 Tax=Saccharothrix sp. NRRL B-16314 TaxID=1463825 RepID=UPI0005257E14|nr:tryptophan synthase subunit beta [Saccharothrix sp. NRRL B-16314]
MRPPDATGRFGRFGGRYLPEALMPAAKAVEAAFREAWADAAFTAEYRRLLATYVGRPTPLTECARLSEVLGVRVLLKREDLAHTGSHKINNVLGQALLAQRMGKRKLIAETGAGQHGVATATAAALLGLACTVYMGRTDVRRQELNVFRMELLGAEVVPVTSANGTGTLKEATNGALRAWVNETGTAHYCVGSTMGPHPYPWMVREFQRVIGDEARAQCADRLPTAVPDVVVACVGGGSNAAGTFAGFVDTPARLVGVEAAGGSAVDKGKPGVLHGFMSHFLQDDDSQVLEAHSISAGLDYPGVGPEHVHLDSIGRAHYTSVTDEQAMRALKLITKTEGILPALESAHALAWVVDAAATGELSAGSTVLVTLSGRGDKDIHQIREHLR